MGRGLICSALTTDALRYKGLGYPARQPIGDWVAGMFRKGFEILHDGSEVEFVARSGETAQAHSLEAVVGLQVRKAHLNLFALPS